LNTVGEGGGGEVKAEINLQFFIGSSGHKMGKLKLYDMFLFEWLQLQVS
jgi:hypothetical protein